MLIVLDDAGIQLPDEDTLFRRSLQKLVPELRATLLSRTWVFPQDPGSPPRKPRTWEECAECATQELESRADAKAPREMVNAISIGTVHTCGYCRRQDHHMEICPKRSADLRGDAVKRMANFETGGRIVLPPLRSHGGPPQARGHRLDDTSRSTWLARWFAEQKRQRSQESERLRLRESGGRRDKEV